MKSKDAGWKYYSHDSVQRCNRIRRHNYVRLMATTPRHGHHHDNVHCNMANRIPLEFYNDVMLSMIGSENRFAELVIISA